MRRFMLKGIMNLAVLFGTTCIVFGEEAQIKSLPAQAAVAKCEKVIAEAEKVERLSEIKALKELIPVLEKSKTVATKAADLTEANALDQKVKETKDRIEKLNDSTTTTKPLEFEVFGNKGWQKLGPVVKGQRLRITATGEWTDNVVHPELSCGPDGLGGKFRLLAQINGNNSFTIGSHLEFVVPESGMIEFGMADSGHVNGGGKLLVTVRAIADSKLPAGSGVDFDRGSQ